MAAAVRFLEILKALCRHEVDFVVVGGVAAVLEGAPVSTFDLDVMHRRTEENQRRLLAALQELNARYADPAGRMIVPDALKLATLQLHRLVTDSGPLDILTEIAPGLSFEEVRDETVVYDVAGLAVRVLSLEAVIRSKEHADRDKDRAALPLLRKTLLLRAERKEHP
jgi:hypothetical protein